VPRYQNVRGTRDLLPGEIERWQYVESIARRILGSYGFREIRTPALEPTELFVRSVGKSSDIVSKQMFRLDLGEDSVSLRPEGTAPVVRAFIQGALDRRVGCERLYYIGPMFRYERPQKGRQRQFNQIGVEVIGSQDPLVDAETIEMLLRFLSEIDISGTSLLLNSVGDATCRPLYRDALKGYLSPRLGRLCADCTRRYEENPLRVFDCKVDSCRREISEAPAMSDHLCDACRQHFSQVCALLDAYGISYRLEPRLVRGLDYYVRTAFEIIAEGLGAQNSLMGGGRYDGLVRELGGKDLPGFGWALGMERLLMLVPENAEGEPTRVEFLVASLVEGAKGKAALAARVLREAGRSTILDVEVRSLSAHLRRAGKMQISRILVIGDEELASGSYLVRDMTTGDQQMVPTGELGRYAMEVGDDARA
jgi:histidyl-tRNA synthetase